MLSKLALGIASVPILIRLGVFGVKTHILANTEVTKQIVVRQSRNWLYDKIHYESTVDNMSFYDLPFTDESTTTFSTIEWNIFPTEIIVVDSSVKGISYRYKSNKCLFELYRVKTYFPDRSISSKEIVSWGFKFGPWERQPNTCY